MKYKLYSAPLRRMFKTHTPRFDGAADDIRELKAMEAWKHRPAVILDADGRSVDANLLDVDHTPF